MKKTTTTTPKTIQRRAARVAATSWTATLLAYGAWVFSLVEADPLPTAMGYATLMLVAVTSTMVACMAGLSLTTHQAFAAGLRMGRRRDGGADDGPGPRHLHAVD